MSNSVKLEEDTFGCFTDKRTGETSEVKRYTWTNSQNVSVQILSYGNIITTIKYPDKFGNIEDINLGYNDLQGYQQEFNPYFGAVIGRVGNRIANGKMTIEGKEYSLVQNNGEHHLHGGTIGFDKVNWNSFIKEPERRKVVMSYLSRDMEEGYPGDLLVNCTYELTEDNSFLVSRIAVTSKPTVANFTHHPYFNLAGHDKGSCELFNHLVSINADRITEVNDDLIPTGKLLPVTGTNYDLRIPRSLGDIIPLIKQTNGFDNNFCVSKGTNQDLAFVAKAEHPPSGRVLEVYSDRPGVQFYTAYNIVPHQGKGWYDSNGAFCFEPQFYPDSINQKSFPRVILYPGEFYVGKIVYRFLTIC